MSYNPISEAQRTKGSVQVAERSSSRDEDSSLVAITSAVSVGQAMGKALGACQDSTEQPTCTSEEPTTTTSSSSTSSSTASVAADMEEMQRALAQLQLLVAQYKTSSADDQRDLTQHSLDQIQDAQDKWLASYRAYEKAKRTASWFNPLGAIMNLVNLVKPGTISQASMDSVNNGFNEGMGDIGKYTGLSFVNDGLSEIIKYSAMGLTMGLEGLSSATGERSSLSDNIESCVSTVLVSAAVAVAIAFVCPEGEEGIAEGAAEEGVEMANLGGEAAGAGAGGVGAAGAVEAGGAAAEAGNFAANAMKGLTEILGKVRQLMTLISRADLGGYVFCEGLIGSGFPAKFASTVSSNKDTQMYVELSLTVALSLAAAITGARAFGGVVSDVIDSIGAPRALYYLQRAQLIIDASIQAQVAAVKTAGGFLEQDMGDVEFETALARAQLDMITDSSKETQESSGVVLQNITSEITSITQAVAKSGQAVSQALSA